MACILADLDMDAVWAEADERERRVFVENLLAWIKVFPDHLEVKVVGSQDERPALRGWTVGTGECWCRRADVTVLMGLDGATFLSDAVSEPPSGEHWTVLSFQL